MTSGTSEAPLGTVQYCAPTTTSQPDQRTLDFLEPTRPSIQVSRMRPRLFGGSFIRGGVVWPARFHCHLCIPSRPDSLSIDLLSRASRVHLDFFTDFVYSKLSVCHDSSTVPSPRRFLIFGLLSLGANQCPRVVRAVSPVTLRDVSSPHRGPGLGPQCLHQVAGR